MAKVVTGTGLNEFIESGKHEVIKADKAPEKAAEPVKAEIVQVVQEAEKSAVAPPEEGLEADDIDLSEQVRRKIGKKHRAMKEAQEAAADAENFAKNQYDRARLAEERAAALEKELSETKKALAPPKEEVKKPDIKDFTDDKGQIRWTDYTEASADYAARRAVAEDRAQRAQESEVAQKAQIEAQFRARLDQARDKYPDFSEVVGASTTMLPNAVLQYITESENGPDISYFLASNPAAADRISKLPPIKAIAEIGKLEVSFEKPVKAAETAPEPTKAPERGGAPPPITPISTSGAGTVQTDPAKMNFRELRDFERAKRKKT